MATPERSANQLNRLRLNSREEYMDTAFSRNLGLVSYEEQCRLRDSRVAVIGLGGVGGVHLMTLARTGIGAFNLAEMDVFSPVNVNRQFGATLPAFGRPKLDTMITQARSVNPFLDIRTFPQGLSEDTLEAFLDDVQLVVDGVDFFAFDIRRKLFNRALERGIPVITAGPLGFSAALLVFRPGGMNFDEYFAITDDMPQRRKYLHFAMGLAPRPSHVSYLDRHFVSLDEKRGPSMGAACQVCSGLAATEAVRLLLEREGGRSVPQFTQFDPYRMRFVRGTLRKGLRSPLQRAKLWFVEKALLPPVPTYEMPPEPPPEVDISAEAPLTETVKAKLLETGRWGTAGIATRFSCLNEPQQQASAGFRLSLISSTWEKQRIILRTPDAYAPPVKALAAFEAGMFTSAVLSAGASAGIQVTPHPEQIARKDSPSILSILDCEADGIIAEEIMADTLLRSRIRPDIEQKDPVPFAVRQRIGQLLDGSAEIVWLDSASQAENIRLALAGWIDAGLTQERISGLPASLAKPPTARSAHSVRKLNAMYASMLEDEPKSEANNAKATATKTDASHSGELYDTITPLSELETILDFLGICHTLQVPHRAPVSALFRHCSIARQQLLRVNHILPRQYQSRLLDAALREALSNMVQSTRSLAVLTLPAAADSDSGYSPELWMQAGRAFRTVWNLLTHAGYSVHPLYGLTYGLVQHDCETAASIGNSSLPSLLMQPAARKSAQNAEKAASRILEMLPDRSAIRPALFFKVGRRL